MRPVTVAIVAVDNFSPFHYSVPSILFSDKVAAQKRFTVKICAEAPGTLSSQEGFSLHAAYGYEAINDAGIVIVPYWDDTDRRPPQTLLAALRAARQNGAQIVGLCLGAFVLGYAGLLEGKRAATHWAFEEEFQARFPAAKLDINALYVDDEGIITSAGTAAALDCCLYIIRQRFGSVVANQIARKMVVPPHREGGQAQYIARPVPESTRDQRINALLDYLRQHLHEPHDLNSLAQRVRMSRRTLSRHFMNATGCSVAEWLIRERLRLSQTLLESSQLPVERIAGEAGFQSAVTWRQHFKSHFGVSPTEWRKTFRGVAS
ncbi:GlxA family transcriptional regulator [Citrobacter rodentium]|uniref:AraC-family transcriptional regulator n=2 Tax=Citrobacter rodentium TaxID=67825 RepID=D2TK53_CITRI|nr:helix-turn-helix domain-containing protein [Citrobacter rodentium]KIQ52738.1 AraC family transcriptional regulator [Citrobacter rodentium]QBY31629.1 helix-turn-helix domain-containing protein [Citrobacter rodentium]UHO31013.1 helix-turn-helix domain-containing protein [Citrobacter rodentium NBRC 105723 = DSM 16636]CBG87183.1 putative AraC-family transcriptional regulator [Citrobacter rodentium ICC168]HAT8015496.1 GlxA family transcriptional regulator [Citrobacter rodentium NBRC 105723 = DSM